MTYIFDGRKFAFAKRNKTARRVRVLKKRGITPKLASIMIGHNQGSELYLSLKKKAAKSVGASLEVIPLPANISMYRYIETIEELNKDGSVHGVMLQLPLPQNLKHKKKDIINAIALQKDVDGMRDNSSFTAPVVRAAQQILSEATNDERQFLRKATLRVVVVGENGFVGGKLLKGLRRAGYRVVGVDLETKNLALKTRNADVLISATGVPDLIKPDMVKEGVVLIDVGAPKGDVDRRTYQKASFVSPVPGGVGPVTISYLLENLVDRSFRI